MTRPAKSPSPVNGAGTEGHAERGGANHREQGETAQGAAETPITRGAHAGNLSVWCHPLTISLVSACAAALPEHAMDRKGGGRRDGLRRELSAAKRQRVECEAEADERSAADADRTSYFDAVKLDFLKPNVLIMCSTGNGRTSTFENCAPPDGSYLIFTPLPSSSAIRDPLDKRVRLARMFLVIYYSLTTNCSTLTSTVTTVQ